jgi:energy-coupling factor transporter transmembrane protein EcfT
MRCKLKIHENFVINGFTLFILAFIYLISILVNPTWYTNWYIVLLSFINIYIFTSLNKRNIKLLLIIIVSLVPIAIATFLTTVIFTKQHLDLNAAYLLGIQLVSRMYVLVISSAVMFSAINFEQLILYAMQRLHLPVMIGYALLSAINALKHFEVEAMRIRNAYLMRFASKRLSITMLYPLLVSAARYAFHQGVSMENRGLNANKTFVRQVQSWGTTDTLVIILNIITILFILFLWG